MDLDNLNQFDRRLFNKYFGIYVKTKRLQMGYSLEALSELIPNISCKNLKLIESGIGRVSQIELDLLCKVLELSPQELLNIGRITQVNTLLSVYAETNEHYPK